MQARYLYRGGSEGEFVNLSSGPIRGGLLDAIIPDRLVAEYGERGVILFYHNRDTFFYGKLAELVRESILKASDRMPNPRLQTAG